MHFHCYISIDEKKFTCYIVTYWRECFYKVKMKKLLFILLILFFISSGFVYFYLSHLHDRELSDKQRQKALEALLGRRPILTGQPRKDGWTHYQGTYFSVDYPAAATIYANAVSSNSASVMELLQFQDRQSPRYFFTIQVIPRDTVNGLGELPGVRMRNIEKDTYKQKDTQVAGQPAIIFSKQDDSTEKTGFIYFKKREYSLAITGSDPKVTDVFDGVARTIKLY